MPPSFWIFRNERLSSDEKMFALDFDLACMTVGQNWEREVAKKLNLR